MIIVVLVILAIIVIVVASRKGPPTQTQPRFTPLPEEARAEIERIVDSGKLPLLADTHIALHRGEAAPLVLDSELMKEVVDREYRGGHKGMSICIAKGVRYYTGSSRGKMVTIGSHIEVADRGQLTFTSRRTVFTGFRRTIEIPHARVVQITHMLDGLQLHASNRANPPLFRVAEADAEVLAAVVDLAHQRVLALVEA